MDGATELDRRHGCVPETRHYVVEFATGGGFGWAGGDRVSLKALTWLLFVEKGPTNSELCLPLTGGTADKISSTHNYNHQRPRETTEDTHTVLWSHDQVGASPVLHE